VAQAHRLSATTEHDVRREGSRRVDNDGEDDKDESVRRTVPADPRTSRTLKGRADRASPTPPPSNVLPPRMLGRVSPAVAAALTIAGATFAQTPHNVLVLVLDDVGVELVGAYDKQFQLLGMPQGDPAKTPAIDDLMAGRGMMFTRAWACPLCSPTRAAALTGRMPSSTGLGRYIKDHGYADNPGLSPHEVLLPQALRTAPTPYVSAALGKWHLAGPRQALVHPSHPLGQPEGEWFDIYAGSLFGVSFDPLAAPMQTGYFSWSKYYATGVTPGRSPCPTGAAPCYVQLSTPPIQNYATVDTADDAMSLMRTLPEPWFLWVAFNSIHTPLHDAPSGAPLANCAGYTPPPYCDTSANPTPEAQARCMLQVLDSQIARLLCAADDAYTTVVLFGDNGGENFTVRAPYLPGHGKGTVYEGGARVPLIVRSPRLPAALQGSTNDSLVQISDVFATVCELAGMAATPPSAIDSVSFVPLIDGDPNPTRDTAYTEVFFPNFRPDPTTGGPPAQYVGVRHNQAIRDERFKLIRKWSRVGGAGAVVLASEFYDLEQGGPPSVNGALSTPTPDFFEQNDLLASGAALDHDAAQALARLTALLDSEHPPLVY